jgi:hypothetical protein
MLARRGSGEMGDPLLQEEAAGGGVRCRVSVVGHVFCGVGIDVFGVDC